MTKHQAPLSIYETAVHPQWLDYNNHMNEGYYGVVFSDASDALLTYMGFNEAYLQQTHCTFYTAQTQIIYLRELKADDLLRVTTHLLGADSKRLHYIHALYQADAGYLAATQEGVMLHVNQTEGRVKPMPPFLHEAGLEIAKAHSVLPLLDEVGRPFRKIRAG